MDKDRVSVYATTESGRDTASAIVNSDARLGFEASKSRPPEDYSLEFVDYPFTADTPPEFDDYLPIIKREQPTVAVAPDIEDGRDPNDVFDMADEMANYAEHVVVVPKEIEPAEVPDRFRTGLPLADFGSDSPWEWADFLECESVHILGGPPQAQRQVAQTYIPVDSVDGATMVKASNFGKVWQWPDTWIEVPWSDFYDRIETSLNNTVAALNGARIADEMPDTPDRDEIGQDPDSFEETHVPPRGPPQCQYYACENDSIGGTAYNYCDDHRNVEGYFDDLEQQADEIDESIPDEIRTDGGTATNPTDMSTTENTNGAAGDELPETVGDFHRLNTESISLDHNTGNINVAYSPEDTNDLAYLEDTGNGWNAWFVDEASVGTLEMDTDLDVSVDDIRLGYAETRSEALSVLLTALEENTARELRLEAREDTEFEVVGADHSQLLKVTYPDVKGKRVDTLEAYYDTDEEIGEASDDELLSLSGIGPKTVEGVRKQINGESDDEPGIDLSDVGIEPSGITFDDPITEITGVGDSSDLITGDGVETVGEWWEIGVPFYGVAGGWHDSALEDILGAEFVDEEDPQDLMRIFTGYTAGTVYDREGEKLGGLPSALFEMFDWGESAWAWYIANQRSKEYRPDEAETPGGTYQFAFATGEDVPREVLSFDPDEDPYAGLERVGNATVPEGEYADPVVKYNAAEVDGVAAPPRPTVEFVSTLFGTDYSDPDIAREHVEVVVVPGSSGTRTSEYVALFHHPTAPAHAMIEGDNLVMPEDFDLEGEVYDPVDEFDHIEERGPTMNRPVPEEEEYTLPMSPLDRRQLENTGLAPSDFEIIDGAMAPENVHEKGYHPADQDRDRDVAPDVVAEDLAQQRDHEQNAEAAEAAGVYDPTTEFDDEPADLTVIEWRGVEFPENVNGYTLTDQSPHYVEYVDHETENQVVANKTERRERYSLSFNTHKGYAGADIGPSLYTPEAVRDLAVGVMEHYDEKVNTQRLGREGLPEDLIPETITLSYGEVETDLPASINGWEWTEPKDDAEAGTGHGPTYRARYERGSEVLGLKGGGTNHRVFYWPNGERETRTTAVGPITFGETTSSLLELLTGQRELPESNDPDPLYVVVHKESASKYIEGFGEDEAAAEVHAEEMGDKYEVQYDPGHGIEDESDEPEIEEPDREIPDELTDIDGLGEATADKFAENGIETPEDLAEAWADRARWAGYAKPVLSTLPQQYNDSVGGMAAQIAHDLDLERDESGPMQMVDQNGNQLSDQADQVDDSEPEADDEADVYDPTSEFDELEEPTEISAIGDGRRSTIDAIDAKDRLDDVQTFNTIGELTNAVRELSLARRDGRTYMSPPENVIDSLESYYQDLPDEAQREYLNDHVIHRRVNAARKAFNRWMGKKKREQEIPSAMEAGPSNYPTKKAQETSRYAREGNDELKERIDKVRAAAKGAHQRALESIGSSVAEQNQQKAENQMERRRNEWEPGDIVVYRNPSLHAAAIVRLNTKSVRVQRRNNLQNADIGGDGEFRRATIDLDSDHITKYDPEDLSTIEDSNLDRDQTVPETLEAAQRQMLGAEWVEENRDLTDDGPNLEEQGTTAAEASVYDPTAEDESGPYDHYPSYACNECGHEATNSPRPLSGPCIYCDGEMVMTDKGTEAPDEPTPTIYAAEKDRWPLLKPYEHHETAVDDLPGIGKTTRDKIDGILGDDREPTIATHEAVASMEGAILRDVGDVIPSDDALETLINAIEQMAERKGHTAAGTHLLREGYNSTDDESEQDGAQAATDSSEEDISATADGTVDGELTADVPDELTEINGLGDGTVDRLAEAGIETPEDLGRAYAESEQWDEVEPIIGRLAANHYKTVTRHAAEIAGSIVERDRQLAEQYHRSRTPDAQNMDESIDAQKQTTSFAEWIKAPNMMDLIGVDNVAAELGIDMGDTEEGDSEAVVADGGVYDPIGEFDQ